MGLMPGPGGNPFTNYNKQSVIGQLKATGSRDKDVLYAQKDQLVAPQKNLKILGWICIVCGAFFTITVILAIAGIPFMIFGWWLLRFSKRNIQTVEDAFAEYTASAVRAVALLLAIGIAATPLFAQTGNGARAAAPQRTVATPPADANGFKIGDTVEINTGFGWMKATILSMNGNNYRVRSQIGVEITKTFPDELRRIAPPPGAAALAGRGASASNASGSNASRGAAAGTPPRPGYSSCAGKIEGRYTTAGLAGSLTVEFRSGKAIMKDAIGDNDTTLECWMKGDKIYLHQPGDAPSQDMPIDINDDGTLQTPMGELKKKGK
jgi:hypothetical protein